MRFLRFLCNFLLFLIVALGISMVQMVAYDAIAAQSNDVLAVHILPQDENHVAIYDNYSFTATDIKVGIQQNPKYRIRSICNGWEGMRWADTCLDVVIASVKPVVVPVAQLNALKNYHGSTINDEDFETYLLSAYESEAELNNALYEAYVIYDEGYGEAYTVDGTMRIEEYTYTGEYDSEISYSK